METERLIIDSIRESDREDYFHNISHDKKVLETFVCQYAESLDNYDFAPYPNRDDLFAIRLKDSEKLIGIILHFDDTEESCEIGFGIGSEYWNQGYTTEAVKRFLRYCFEEKGFRTVYASFFSGNDASRRVMEKCGMIFDHFSEKEMEYLGEEKDLTYFVIRNDKKKARKTVLVTAFEPFGEDTMNPTAMILERLPDEIDGYEVRKLYLPVEYVRSRELAFKEYDDCLPDAVIMMGQAGGRAAITPETTGRNIMNHSIPDNAGFEPDHLPVVEGGPDALHSTLPNDKIVEAVNASGITCEISDDAGEYVCNCLLYGMLFHNKGTVPTGFIHVPFIPEQGHENQPSMLLEEMEKGMITVIRTSLS